MFHYADCGPSPKCGLNVARFQPITIYLLKRLLKVYNNCVSVLIGWKRATFGPHVWSISQFARWEMGIVTQKWWMLIVEPNLWLIKATYTLGKCVWPNTSERVHSPSVDFAANMNEHVLSCLFTVCQCSLGRLMSERQRKFLTNDE